MGLRAFPFKWGGPCLNAMTFSNLSFAGRLRKLRRGGQESFMAQSRRLRLRCQAAFRRNWPASRRESGRSAAANVAVVTVNSNTASSIAALLFSLCRIVGREQLGRVVVVDNNSSDGSREILGALAEAKLIDVIYNDRQRYHGPGLNDGMRFLERAQRNAQRREDFADYVWVIDSDCIALRHDVVHDSVAALRGSGAALCGQFQDEEMPEGYAHVSSLLFDPAQVWRRGLAKFEEHGAPALALQCGMVKKKIPRLNFPFRDGGYLLHLGRGTLRAVRERADSGNKYFSWALNHWDSQYHDAPQGKRWHEEFLDVFAREAPELTPEKVVSACMNPARIRLELPYRECLS
jgi:hypothetical protein